MASCLDVAGFLPAPCRTAAADLLESSAFAYAVGTAVAVAETRRLHTVVMLLGGHRANITAIKWCPAYHSRKLDEPGQIRLASGDADGGVVVWDVGAACPAARLEEVPSARDIMRDYRARTSSDAGGPGGSGSLFPQAQGGGAGVGGATAAAAVGVAAGSGVPSLAWVMPGSHVLAVVLAPALLLLWDTKSGALLSKRELGNGSELFSQLTVDPLDSRQICLCGSNGAVAVLQLTDPAADKIQAQQYRVNLQQQPADIQGGPRSPSSSAPSSSTTNSRLQALFTVCRGLLVLLLPREVLLFDLAMGAPAASTALPANLAPFSSLLGVYGSGVCQGGGDDGGVDFLYALHTDGGLSVWVRVPGELNFKLGCVAPLLQPPLRASGPQVSLCAVKAGLWWRQQGPTASSAAAAAGSAAQTAASTARITAQLSSSLGSSLGSGGAVRQTGGGKHQREGAAGSVQPASSRSSSGSSGATLSGRCLLVCAVTSDSRLWQWELQLPAYPRRSFLTDVAHQPITAINTSIQAARASAVPATVLPQLVGLLHTLPGALTTIALQPCPLLLPTNKQHHHRKSSARLSMAGWLQNSSTSGLPPADAAAAAAAAECVLVGAGPTSTGHLAVFTVRRGLVNPLCPELVSSLLVHREAARGVRWLGPLPLLVSFSSEKSSSGAWRNSLMITDVITGHGIPFRDSTGSESCPLVGIRVSPSGAYILLLFKGAPAELWTPLPPPNATSATPAAAAGSSAAAAAPAPPPATAAAGSGGDASGGDGGGGAAAAAPFAACAGLVKPWRVRLVDLPFSAVEWIVTEEDMHKDEVCCWGEADLPAAAGPANPAAASGNSEGGVSSEGGTSEPWRLGRQTSSLGNRQPSYLAAPSMTAPAAVAVDADQHNPFPFELLAFSLADGRSGVLSFRGRKVHDVNPLRPQSGIGPHSLGLVSAVCGVWPLMLLGDADGTLMAWDLMHGRCSSIATGLGLVRRIQLAPASPPVLSGTTEAALSGAATARGAGVERMRAAVLFSSGQINVYDLDAVGRIRPGGVVSAAAASRLGVVKDICWLPLPSPAGAGSILSVVAEDGSLALLDVSQPLAVRPNFKARQELLREVLSTHSPPATLTQATPGQLGDHTLPGAAAAGGVGSSGGVGAGAALAAAAAGGAGAAGAGAAGVPAAVLGGGKAGAGGDGVSVPVVLLGPGALGCSMLLKQPWVLLLRALLQAGVSQDTLLYISSSSTEDDEEVSHELRQLLPRSAQAVLAHIAAGHSSSNNLARLQQQSSTTAEAQPPASSQGQQQQQQQQQQQPSGGSNDAQAGQPRGSNVPSSAPAGSSRLSRRVSLPVDAPGVMLWGVPDQRFKGDLLALLRQISQLRGCRQLLLPDEWCGYTEAIQSGQLSRRMSVAAQLSGHTDESRFWAALPATLNHIRTLQDAIQQRQQQQQEQQQLSRRTSAASTAAPAGGSSADLRTPAGTPRSSSAAAAAGAGVGTAAGVAAADAGATPTSEASTAAAAAGAAGGDASSTVEADDSVVDASDYDFMVQQALEGSSLQAGQPTPASPTISSTVRGAGGGGEAGMGSPLARRGSGAVVPGRGLYSGPQQQQFSSQGAIRRVAQDRPVRLWDEDLVLSEAQEVLLWHEALPGQLLEGEGLLERRLLEYCCLGDFATAVAFLLSTPPESSVRYYRSVVCALALAATASLRAQGSSSNSTQAAATLHLQAAKVVSAHAASIGDNLLGVPLNCSAGLNADAVALLQEAGMWQAAAALTARTLTGTERAQALSRWASHVRHHEGSVWRCVGILTSAGCLQAAAQVLRTAELPDCAFAYVQACREAGLLIPQLQSSSMQGNDDIFDQQQPQPALELFDILGLRTRMLLQSSNRAANSTGEASSGPELLQLIESEYHQYLCGLVANL